MRAYDGYYFTGDGCHRDKDGYYWVTGRVDDVLNISGHRIGSAEIEHALVTHPAVTEAAVVGYPHDIKVRLTRHGLRDEKTDCEMALSHRSACGGRPAKARPGPHTRLMSRSSVILLCQWYVCMRACVCACMRVCGRELEWVATASSSTAWTRRRPN